LAVREAVFDDPISDDRDGRALFVVVAVALGLGQECRRRGQGCGCVHALRHLHVPVEARRGRDCSRRAGRATEAYGSVGHLSILYLSGGGPFLPHSSHYTTAGGCCQVFTAAKITSSVSSVVPLMIRV